MSMIILEMCKSAIVVSATIAVVLRMVRYAWSKESDKTLDTTRTAV